MAWWPPPRRRAILIVAAVAVLALGGWGLAGLVDGPDADWVRVDRDDLVLGVDVEGTLRAVDTSSLGPPPIAWTWEFKISQMAPEGEEVEKGTPILGFDTSELQRRLQAEMAESEAAAKEIEKKEAELALRAQEDALRLAEAEAKERKALLKVEVPGELSSARELKTAHLDLELARLEIGFLKEKLDASRRSGDGALEALRSQKRRADEKVREIRQAIASMTVKAPRDGTVIYITDWRGEKKKIGDSCWRAEKVMEIPDLSRMMAKGEVDEADASRVSVGQRVTFRLDAHPDEEFTGKTSYIWSTVQQKSWRNPVKVARVEIELDRTDIRRMRPGMRFRGTVETERVEDAVVVPVDAIFPTPEGAVVYRKTLLGVRKVPVMLGRRNDKKVEVLEGLDEGDRISRTDLSTSRGERA